MARNAIENLLYRYAEAVDAGDFATVGALFSEGRYGMVGGDAVRGARAVERLMDQTVRCYDDGTPRTRHLTSNVIVDLSEGRDRAQVRSCFTVFQSVSGGAPEVIVLGRYFDVFERAAAGWRFCERRIRIDQVGDLSAHLKRPEVLSPTDAQQGT